MSLCFMVVVDKYYQRFIPWYIYFCLSSYPDCKVHVLLIDELEEKYSRIVNLFKDNVVFTKGFGQGYPIKDKQVLKALRWIIDKDRALGCDCLYIGDVDLLICPENPSLVDVHLQHCERTKLPYSNSVRCVKGVNYSSPRMSGLHFIKCEPYFEKISFLLPIYRERLRRNELGYENNEMLLYELVCRAGFKPGTGWFRPQHGLHLGLWRNKERERLSSRFWQQNDKESYRKNFIWFCEIEDECQQILSQYPLIEIERMKRTLGREFK